MPLWPTTRKTLLLRLGNPDREKAWQDFSELYQPVIYRFARRSGLQHADSLEITQQAMVRVLRSARIWLSEEPPQSFRAWLKTTIKNLVINFVTRTPKHNGLDDQLYEFEDPGMHSADDAWQEEERRAFLRAAMDQVKNTVTRDAWLTFSRTVLDGANVPDVAAELGKSIGAVYAARARIVKQLEMGSRKLWEESENE